MSAMPVTPALVSQRWRILYVVTPKAMCTSLLHWMARVQREDLGGVSRTAEVTRALTVHDRALWRHTPLLQQLPAGRARDIATAPGWLRLAVTRHPVDRLWSAWQSKLLLREPAYHHRYAPAAWYPRLPVSIEDIGADFAAFVAALERDPALRVADQHWRAQVDLLRPDALGYTYVGSVERGDEVLRVVREHLRGLGYGGELPEVRHNRGLLPRSWVVRDLSLVRRIERLYRADMAAFGYRPLDAPDGTAPPGDAARLAVRAVGEIVGRHERITDLHGLAAAGPTPGADAGPRSYVEVNARGWDRLAREGCDSSRICAGPRLVHAQALLDREGWLPWGRLRRVLCLASGGGQQSALFAALGYQVTVADLSPAQLELDRRAAQRYGLVVERVRVDAMDLTPLRGRTFDLVYQPVSTLYLPDVRHGYRQVAELLSPGGLYLSEHWNPVEMQLDERTPWERGAYRLRHPQRSGPHPVPPENPVCWHYIHPLHDLLGGLCDAGFTIARFAERPGADPAAPVGTREHLGAYIPGFFSVLAVRGQGGEPAC